jgi:hypothetical protein
LDGHKAEALAKLDYAYREHIQAWDRSIEPRTTKSFAEGSKTQRIIKQINRDGNPRFLEGAVNCIRLRCEILGIVEPPRYEKVKDEDDRHRFVDQPHIDRILAEHYGPKPERSTPGPKGSVGIRVVYIKGKAEEV